ncbi:CHAT domain-containing protein [Mycena olivaceomarginata]|nr:CHAT domain-containing protein [Mycena olivaceomarginata]
MYLFSLAVFHHKRYQHSGQHIELDQAIAASEKNVAVLPEGGQGFEARFEALSNLATFTSMHFDAERDRHSLDNSITAWQKLTILLPNGDTRRPGYLHQLAHMLQERFYSFFTLSDLDGTVDTLTHAVRLVSRGDPVKVDLLSSLGRALHSRYSYMGYANDMDAAIAISEELMETVGPHHPKYPLFNSNLATTLLFRYSISQDVADITKAVEILQQVTSITLDNDPAKQRYLENLATSLRMRYEVGNAGSSQDLLLANDAGQKAIDLSPDRAAKAQALLNHGITHALLSKCLDDVGYIDSAIVLQEAAVDLMPDNHPGKAKYLLSVADSFLARFKFKGNITDVQEALNAFSMATCNEFTEASTRLICATRMADLCDAHPELSSPIDAHKLTLNLIPKLVWLGSHVKHRYQRMSIVGAAVNGAISVAIASGDMVTACEWMEQGRCIVWGQILHLRTPLDALREKDLSLAEELTVISHELDQAGITKPYMVMQHDSKHESILEPDISKRHELAARYEALLEKARTIPGMERFMLPKSLAELRTAAGSGHIVLINVHKTRCDALIVNNSSGSVIHVLLPDLKYLEIEKWYLNMFQLLTQSGVRVRASRPVYPKEGDSNDSMMNILEKLWLNLVHPVLARLELLSPVDQPHSPLPRITWCASGPLVFLPLHAAGIYREPNQPKTFDYVVSSYTPTITALLEQRVGQQQSPTGRLLAVSQPNTPRQQPLPGTEQEMASLTESLGGSELLVLGASSATKNAVLQEMGRYPWIHLACHAFQDSTDPTKSGFILYDTTLELIDIMNQSFGHTELAVLSACQTATGAKMLPEEAVHLVAGMLIAGYRSVVGTMWSVGDQDAPIIAQKFYSYLMNDAGGDSKKSAYALHYAVKMLRDKVGEKNFIKWVPFIHTGV